LKKRSIVIIGFSVLLVILFIIVRTTSHAPLLKRNSSFLYWGYSNSGTNNNLKSIKYTGNTFIAVGDEGTIIKSFDGIGWEKVDSKTKETLYDVAYGNGTYIAVGTHILASSDATNWGFVYDFNKVRGYFTHIIFGDGIFIAARYDGSIAISQDGKEWRELKITTHSITSLAFAENKFIALGDCAHGVISENGLDWTPLVADKKNTANKLDWGACDFFSSLGYSSGKYVAAIRGYDDTQFGKIFLSSNGVLWKKAVEFDDTPRGIAVNENGEVVVVGPKMLIESDDKNNWRSYKLDKYSNSSDMDSLESVTFGKGKFVAVGIKGVVLFR
jgi:hypothetical protein